VSFFVGRAAVLVFTVALFLKSGAVDRQVLPLSSGKFCRLLC